MITPTTIANTTVNIPLSRQRPNQICTDEAASSADERTPIIIGVCNSCILQ
ncbi:Uncharacterised protein [Mycobacteroides abscessus subsp. abscessus]|nr:Uncharacterised protein [Mycobacteroides abscessus subsp. abscessus]